MRTKVIMIGLSTPYEKTVLTEIDWSSVNLQRCHDVPRREGEYHKPYANQGRFGPNQRPFLSGVEKKVGFEK
jgi:hypothetical protein